MSSIRPGLGTKSNLVTRTTGRLTYFIQQSPQHPQRPNGSLVDFGQSPKAICRAETHILISIQCSFTVRCCGRAKAVLEHMLDAKGECCLHQKVDSVPVFGLGTESKTQRCQLLFPPLQPGSQNPYISLLPKHHLTGSSKPLRDFRVPEVRRSLVIHIVARFHRDQLPRGVVYVGRDTHVYICIWQEDRPASGYAEAAVESVQYPEYRSTTIKSKIVQLARFGALAVETQTKSHSVRNADEVESCIWTISLLKTRARSYAMSYWEDMTYYSIGSIAVSAFSGFVLVLGQELAFNRSSWLETLAVYRKCRRDRL
ncbi:hypothetical protein KC368_g39 [Hortaea werneckii]|nr:hypothetical protein KC368_g39 [Hortaea werneckii]